MILRARFASDREVLTTDFPNTIEKVVMNWKAHSRQRLSIKKIWSSYEALCSIRWREGRDWPEGFEYTSGEQRLFERTHEVKASI